MSKAIAFAVLAGGMLLLTLGINAYDSSSSDISRLFTGSTTESLTGSATELLTGSATEKSIWLLVGGAAVTVLGLVGLLRGSKTACDVTLPRQTGA
jgi:hypothetical protein